MAENKDNISSIKFRLDPKHLPTLTAEQERRLETAEIDYHDIPEIPDDFWERHRPVVKKQRRKRQITLRIDQDVIDFFQSYGSGYQSHINNVLRSYVNAMKLVYRSHQSGAKTRAVGKHAVKPRPGKGGGVTREVTESRSTDMVRDPS